MSSYSREVSNLVNTPPTVHNVGVSSHHWQLKDMLKINNENLIFPSGFNIMSYNPSTRLNTAIIDDLGFFPTSLACNDDFVAVGGSRGQLAVKYRETNLLVRKKASESINNNLTVFNNKIYICSNDREVKIFSSDLNHLQTIPYVTQANYCSISPNGRYLVIVGDSADVYIYAINHDEYLLIKKLKTVKDGGFGVSWNSMSSMFSVATQDGFVCVWDIRYDDKIHTYESSQKTTHKRAVRNVNFSVKNSLDLMFFTEHSSYMTLCDMRNFERIQKIKVVSDKQITGSMFSSMNDKIFVSTETSTYEYAVNDLRRRTFDS